MKSAESGVDYFLKLIRYSLGATGTVRNWKGVCEQNWKELAMKHAWRFCAIWSLENVFPEW